MKITLSEIAVAVNGRVVSGDRSEPFDNFFHHSGATSPGGFYICLRGARVDGHDFLPDVYSKGCRGTLISDEEKFNKLKDKLPGMSAVLVDDPVEALAALGRFAISRLQCKVVGITGSVGKTTTKEFLSAILAKHFRVGYTPGNMNTEIGMPIALLNFNDDEEIIILEMASRGPGQIAHLCSIAPPDVAVITNVGMSHIECFGNIEGVRNAKFEILEHASESATAVIPGDDESLVAMAAENDRPFVTFGVADGCDFHINNIQLVSDGVGFILEYPEGQVEINIPFGSKGDALNFTAAAAAAGLFGMSVADASEAIPDFTRAAMRLAWRDGPNASRILVDCYNANPQSMRNAIEVIKASRKPCGRVIAVLGDMLELGPSSDEEHKSLGKLLRDMQVDILLTYGDQIRLTYENFKEAKPDAMMFDDHASIASWLNINARENDVILLKGSRGLALEKVLEFLSERR